MLFLKLNNFFSFLAKEIELKSWLEKKKGDTLDIESFCLYVFESSWKSRADEKLMTKIFFFLMESVVFTKSECSMEKL